MLELEAGADLRIRSVNNNEDPSYRRPGGMQHGRGEPGRPGYLSAVSGRGGAGVSGESAQSPPRYPSLVRIRR